MDLIYMNERMEDIGVLPGCKLDLAYGQDENDFEAILAAADHCCGAGFYLYIEGTDYGGIVDDIRSDTAAQEVAYLGRTWHGILDSKIISPDDGVDYLVLTGEANAVIGQLLSRLGLEDLFSASSEDSGLYIDGYQMNRYIPAYEGIRKMLGTVSGKLRFTFSVGKVILSAHPRGIYTDSDEIDSDLVEFKALRHYNPVNHLICLGRGELADREVIHLYRDAGGNIGHEQAMFGRHERAATYDNPNAESLETLETGGIERFKELSQADEIEASLNADDAVYEIQDIVSATDNITGLTATAEITKKIVTIENGQITISYKVGA